MENGSQNKQNSLAIPIAIVFGFGLIALAIYFSGNKNDNQIEPTLVKENQVVPQDNQNKLDLIDPITDADHIKGNPNAPIILVEYSDFECPFCKSYHNTMNRIINELGVGGKVAWVYRHFPLQNIHPSAPYIAEASECVAKFGGDEAFFEFADLVFGERNLNDPASLLLIPDFAERSGINRSDLDECLQSGEMRAEVEKDFNDGLEIGLRGTPFTVLVLGNQKIPINGAQDYNVVKNIVESAIRSIEASVDTSTAE